MGGSTAQRGTAPHVRTIHQEAAAAIKNDSRDGASSCDLRTLQANAEPLTADTMMHQLPLSAQMPFPPPTCLQQPPGSTNANPTNTGLTCDVVAVKAGCVKLLDVGVEAHAHLQQVVHILIHQAISTQHITDLQQGGGRGRGAGGVAGVGGGVFVNVLSMFVVLVKKKRVVLDKEKKCFMKTFNPLHTPKLQS